MLVQWRGMKDHELNERRSPRAVIWDVDGTLIDSGALHFEAWQAIMRDEARELTHGQFHATFGQRNDTVLRTFLGADVSASEIERISLVKEGYYRDLLRSRGIQPLPGVRRWLEAVQVAGWRQAIASSAPMLNIEAIVEALGLADYFDAIASGDDVTHGKPDPETFLLAATRLGVEPGRCVVVEDAPVGIEGARRGGMRCVGVLFAHAALAADIVTRSLDELSPAVLDQLVPEVL